MVIFKMTMMMTIMVTILIMNVGNDISCPINCNYKMAAQRYVPGKRFVSGRPYII